MCVIFLIKFHASSKSGWGLEEEEEEEEMMTIIITQIRHVLIKTVCSF